MLEPTFIVGGGQRCATTYLYQLLDAHPEIYMAKPMWPEPKFFAVTAEFEKGRAYYLRRYFDVEGDYRAVGEKSTSYMEAPEAPVRLKATFPDIRLIFVLRRPIERALSNYWYSVANGLEKETFEHAVFNEDRRIREQPMPQFSNHPFGYLRRGLYARQLERYLVHFDRSRLHVILNKDFDERLPEALRSVYRFVGANPAYAPPDTGARPNAAERFENALTPNVLDYLLDYFHEPNRSLEKLIGRDLSRWDDRAAYET